MSEQTPTAQRYEAELREIAGMLAQAPDGPLRWKQYRLTAIADYIATPTPAPDAVAEGLREALEPFQRPTLLLGNEDEDRILLMPLYPRHIRAIQQFLSVTPTYKGASK